MLQIGHNILIGKGNDIGGSDLEANPNKGQKQAEGSKDEAVELETPSEGGDPGTAKLDLQTLLLVTLPTSRRCLVSV